MRTQFYKMHGLGNDFVIFDERPALLPLTPTRIAALAHRKRGIGCDQLVTLGKPEAEGADVLVRFFNPDGSEAGACGNASRCVAALVAGQGGGAESPAEGPAGGTARLMGAALEPWVEAAEANAVMFPEEHRALFPEPGSGTA